MARERDPETGQWKRQTMRERFDDLVDRSAGPDACWPWLGAIESTGYGRLTDFWKKHSAHRLAFMFEHGEIPEGKHICHSCDNRSCVNPSHLWAGSHQENMDDMRAKGRDARKGPINPLRGEDQPRSRLTELDVIAIRAAHASHRRGAHGEGDTPTSLRGLAAHYGVSTSAIHAVVQRRTWTHLP